MKKEEVKTKVPTWAWVVMGIMALVIIGMYGKTLFSSEGIYESGNEKEVRSWLEDDGYEVISVTYISKDSGFGEKVILDMKSFGSITEQVETALMTLNYFYPEVDDYSITIYTPTKTCYYNTDFLLYNSLRKVNNGENVYVDEKGNLEGFIFDKLAESVEEDTGYKLNLSKYPVDSFTIHSMYNYLLKDPMHCE